MRRKRKRSTTRRPAKRRRRVSQVGGVSPALIVGIGKAGYGITKAIGEHQQKRAKKISDKRWRDYLSGNENPMEGNRLIVPLCEKTYKKTFVGLNRG